MARSKIPVTKRQGGLGRRAQNTDNVLGFLMSGVAVSGGAQLNTVYKLRSIRDAENLGLNLAYDTTNNVLVYRRLLRIYTRNPSAEVHLQLVAQARTLTQMLDIAYSTTFAKNMLRDAGGRIKYLGVARNPATGYTPTLSGGLDADVLAAIPKAQGLYDSEAAEFRFCQIVIEGRSFNGSVGSATDLRGLGHENVSVFIGQDPVIRASHADHAGYAAVEDFLGCLSVAAVSQNVGENNRDLFNIQNVAAGFYSGNTEITKCVGLSSDTLLSGYVEQDLATLDEKGYIFIEPVTGLAGLYINDTHTCTAIESDYAYVENNAVIDKAITLARTALLPIVNARLKADTTSGQLAAVEEKGIIDVAVDSLSVMEKDGDISGGIEAEICPDNPDYDLLGGDDLDVGLSFVPMIIGRRVTLSIGFRNPKN